MTFEQLVSLIEIEKPYLYRNRFGKPTRYSFVVTNKDGAAIEFFTASAKPHKLNPGDWNEVVTNLHALRSGLLKRKQLKTWKPSYAYAFIGHFEAEGMSFLA